MRMSAAEDSIVSFEAERVVSSRGCHVCLSDIIQTLFLEDYITCYGGCEPYGSKSLNHLSISTRNCTPMTSWRSGFASESSSSSSSGKTFSHVRAPLVSAVVCRIGNRVTRMSDDCGLSSCSPGPSCDAPSCSSTFASCEATVGVYLVPRCTDERCTHLAPRGVVLFSSGD